MSEEKESQPENKEEKESELHREVNEFEDDQIESKTGEADGSSEDESEKWLVTREEEDRTEEIEEVQEDEEDSVEAQEENSHIEATCLEGTEVGKKILQRLTKRRLHKLDKVRQELVSPVNLMIKDKKESYTFNWKEPKLVVEEKTAESSEAVCNITIHSKELTKIISGKLNPQIAMLSDKINLTGKTSLAVYFFNLLTPHN